MEFIKPTINIGMIGHVAHGKSSITKAMSGITTTKFKKEKERNITIKLGYANAKIYKSNDKYCVQGSDAHISQEWDLVKHISFVDCPGHDSFMSTMISGASVMDAAILIIAANEKCPQPQTQEHLMAIEVISANINPKNIIIVQNKIDLVTPEKAKENYYQIKNFIKGTIAENAPIIPTCAVLGVSNKGYGIETICKYISERFIDKNSNQTEDSEDKSKGFPGIKDSEDKSKGFPGIKDSEDKSKGAIMSIIRSFDINKVGTKIPEIKGGVIGGTILQGSFNIGDSIIIKPGILTSDGNAYPITTTINTMFTEKTSLKSADKGGLIAIGTNLDPSITAKDFLVGSIVEKKNSKSTKWKMYKELKVEYSLFKRVVGTSLKEASTEISKKDVIVLNIGSNLIQATILKLIENDEGKNKLKLKLKNPIYSKKENIISISKKIDNKIRLIGYGKILK